MPINHQLKSSASPVEASREPLSLLAINGGSSSIRFALYEEGEPLRRRLVGKVDRVGQSGMTLTFKDFAATPPDSRIINADDHPSAVDFLLDWLETQQVFASVRAVGHRVVHGMTHSEPERVTPELLDELRRITPFDPDHLSLEIELIEAFRQRHPALPQVACFDTAVSPDHAASCQSAANSATLRGGWRSPLRLPRFVLRIPDGGARTSRRSSG